MVTRETLSARILLASLSAGVLVCIDVANGGSRNAVAFDGFNVEVKSGPSRDQIFINGQFRDSGWFSIKADGSVVDLNPMRADALTWHGFTVAEPNQMEKSAVTDTRFTLGVWDDRVRWSSRQAVSNYIKPGTDLEYLRQAGVGFNSGATSQRLEASVFKSDSMRLAVFAQHARVGAHFAAPDFLIKRQDPFSKRDSTTSQFGATIEHGAMSLTLEQLAQQSLAQERALTLVQNRVGLSFNFDQLMSQSGGAREGISWFLPSSAWLSIGQGRVKALGGKGSTADSTLADTTSEVSYGLAWNVGKIYANVGYWHSDYKSQIYSWTGSGINGSVGFHEGPWTIDLYFDVSSALQSYGLDAVLQPATQVTSGFQFRTRF